jgi:hypothetical protein
MNNNTRAPAPRRDFRAIVMRVVTFLGGIYFFLYFVLPEALLESLGVNGAHESISNGFIAVGAMAIGLGIINIVASHGSRVIFLKQGWFFSIALLFGLIAMISVTAGQWRMSQRQAADVRRVQIVGEFAGRIVEDAKAGAGNEKSVSPAGTFPAVSQRVDALRRYGGDILATIRSERDGIYQTVAANEALKVLLGELESAAAETEKALASLPVQIGEQLDSQAESALLAVSGSAARLGSTYSIVKRKDAEHLMVNRLYSFLYDGLFNQLGSAMFALLGVYIAAAAYRAFRIRSIESALMMTAALIVMLGQISFGKFVYEDMPAIRQWLLEVPNSAAFRAIRLGAGVAGLLLALRMWLSIESSPGSRGGKQ